MKYRYVALALCLALLPVTALAQSPRVAEIIDARMRTGWQLENGSHMAALHIRLAEDWITYWRHPGESGIAPQLDITGSRNLAGARIHWPEPRLYFKAGMASIGYSRDVVLPIELTPQTPGQPMALDGRLHIGVCDDICIPVDLALRLDLADTGSPDGLIATALTRKPRAARKAGLQSVSCSVTPERRGMRLSVSMTLPQQDGAEFALVELAGSPASGRAMASERVGDTLTGHTMLRLKPGEAIDRSAIRTSIVSAKGVLEHQGCTLD